jgi:hypothetical protein
MATLHINRDEQEYLATLLDNTLSDLRAEIAQTDSPFYKDELRKEKEMIAFLSERIKNAREEPQMHGEQK